MQFAYKNIQFDINAVLNKYKNIKIYEIRK